jgi:multidrug/hemolysin transport system permease protein
MILWQLVSRNLKRYLRDKAAVFFSFLSVIIILALYILFLGKMQSDSLASHFGSIDGIDWLVASWIMSGIIVVSTVTVPLGAIGNLIDDRVNLTLNDFYASPISRNTLALSYLISAWVIGFIMVLTNFIVANIYVLMQGGELLSFIDTLKVLGLIILSIMTFSSFFFYISIFMKTRNAFGTLSTLVGTFIGFLGGIYIPIGVLSKNVQTVMNILPTASAVTLMRRLFMDGAIDKVFSNAPQEVYDSYASIYGLNVEIGNKQFENWHMLLSLIIFMAVFYLLSVLKLRNSKL